ncbi:fused response regulator/phosphatase [Roseinatronobacter alkalisoli]|uniref:fused response regulator/phosphatase n=1 Tax=Roseinatronobacter alkalisoli TaxID=3028235 RepID=UPI003082318F
MDDSRAQRLIFQRHLQGWGYETTEAASGEDALDLCGKTHFDLVLSDWMMPGMNGLQFCQKFRAQKNEFYSYFILLTTKNDKTAVAEGLNVGADDFLTKPVSTMELRARISAGERLLDMEREVRKTLQQLQQVHDALERDLQEARKLQHALIRERFREFGRSQLAFLLQSSGHVGGDLVGAFRISDNRIGVYSIDVSGHGVAAAMLSARISALFSEGAQSQNIAFSHDRVSGETTACSPAQVAARMNDLMLAEMETETYLTLAYADLDLVTGRASIVQAGHPHPAVQRKGGNVEFVGMGGLPVGLIPQASYSSFDVILGPGDRLFLYSDGITECQNTLDQEFGQDRLGRMMESLVMSCGLDFLDSLKWQLGKWAGKDEFSDDVSGVIIEFNDYAPSDTMRPKGLIT